jgi:hypothetical protein
MRMLVPAFALRGIDAECRWWCVVCSDLDWFVLEGGSYDAIQGNVQVGRGMVAVETASASGEAPSGIVSVRSGESCRRKSGDVIVRVGGSQAHYSPSEAILMRAGCTGTGVSIKANEVYESSESWGMVPSPTSAGVVANVPRSRDGSLGPINKVKGRGFINAEIEHFADMISAFVVLLRISFFIIGYTMGANAIHSTVTNVLEGLLLIGLTLIAKHKRMMATNQEGVETIGCAFQNNFMNGTGTSTCTNVLLCALLPLHHVCKQ